MAVVYAGRPQPSTPPHSLRKARTALLPRVDWRYGLGLGLLIALYYGAAHLGYALRFTGPVAAIVWLPAGVAIGFLYLRGLRYWPGVLVADLLVNNYTALPFGSAVGQSCGNLLEVVVAALLMLRLIPDGAPLASVRRLARLLAALAVGTAVSATVGLLSLRAGGVVTTDALPKLWRTWWLGDLCGALIVVPLALAWYGFPPPDWLRKRAGEGVVVLMAVIGLSELAARTTRPVAYIVFPGLIYAAIRFRQRGATLAVAIAAGHAVWATTHYEGAFVFHSITNSILVTQLFIAVASLSTLLLATVVSEREELAERLRASRERLVRAGDVERQRIERNLHDGAQQRLTALAVHLGIGAEEAERQPRRAPALFARAERDLLLAIDDLRQLAHGMDPPLLRKNGLASAIADVARQSSTRVEPVEVPSTRFDEASETTAYFLVAEAIANAQKHAHATSIRVHAEWASGLLHVEIVDDGMGGAVETDGGGLTGLRDRVEALGGRFILTSEPRRGTRVAAAIPAVVAGH